MQPGTYSCILFLCIGHNPQLAQAANNPIAIQMKTTHHPGIIFTTVPKKPIFMIVFTVNNIHKDSNSQIKGTSQPRNMLNIRINGLSFRHNKNGNAKTSLATKTLPNKCATGLPPGSEKLSNKDKNLSKVNNCANTNTVNTAAYA